MQRRPSWLKVRLPGGGQYYDVRRLLRQLQVSTVCVEAHCPNTSECWGCGTATFMILGEVCTRGCRFCAVATGQPAGPPLEDEPLRVAEAASGLGLRYVVLTSVDRDDLADGGAAHFAATVEAVQQRIPGVLVEVLTPDFSGDGRALGIISGSGAQVLGHNLETTRSLTPSVRDPRCSVDRSLAVLRRYRALRPDRITKSSLLLGLGETEDEVLETMKELRAAGVDWITLGQYLRPTRAHHPVQRYVTPAAFQRLAHAGREMGFPMVTSGPLVRSSYRAGEQEVARLLERRAAECGDGDSTGPGS